MKERIRSIVPRIGVYLIGVLLVSIGVVPCVRSRLGISPISSVPYVISQMTPWTLGEMTMVFHLANSAILYAMERRLVNVRVLLQTDDGRTLLVEVNDGYALGCYGLQHNLYAKLLAARWAELVGVPDACPF